MPSSPGPLDALPPLFTVAQARDLGVSRGRLRGRHVQAPAHGLRVRTGGAVGLPDLVRALQSRAPGTVASHTTAAQLWGIWLPRELEGGPIHLSRPRQAGGAPRRRGVVGHEMDPRAAVVVHRGIPLTTPAATWAALAAGGLGLDDLVAAGDSLLQRYDGPAGQREPGAHPRCTVEELRALVEEARGRRGARRLREALDLLRPGADSRPETLVRLAVVQAGFPEPAVNPLVRLSDGSCMPVDLVWERERVCIQYEGDHHRTDPRQWRRDIERDRRMQAEGWIVLRVTASVLGPVGLARLVDDLAQYLPRALDT
ncbi:hypothetical protein [Micrococcus sp.]|uniref:hypothetical protein n=1 Tax=Micrococcus sp. TaxID=1271 RepID=UPI002A90E93E|nr:hypothetical protein [Micrococcus sp.]MDY6056075.1 hypothetical protein [Micrococcus sp.]